MKTGRRARTLGIGLTLLLMMTMLPMSPASLPVARANLLQPLGQFLEFEKGAYGPNEVVRVEFGKISYVNDCESGPRDYIYPFADIYVALVGTSISGTLQDDSGTPNTVWGSSQGAFVDEIVASTLPAGQLAPGEYSVVIDECQDGTFDPGTDAFFPRAFRVYASYHVPPVPPSFLAFKEPARRLSLEYLVAAEASGILIDAATSPDEVFKKLGDGLKDWAKDRLKGEEIGKPKDAAKGWQSPLDMAKDMLQVTLANAAKHYAGIAADPPDPTFGQPSPLPETFAFVSKTGAPNGVALARWMSAIEAEAAAGAAFLRAVERYQGAQEQRDGDAAVLHAREVARYAAQLAARADETTAAQATVRGIVVAEAESINASSAAREELRARLASGGLTVAEKAEALGLGLTEAALRENVTALVQQPADLADATDLLATLDALAAARGDVVGAAPALAADMLAIADALVAEGAGRTLPSLTLPPSVSATAGAPVTLSATASDGAEIWWDLDGDGAFHDATGPSVTTTYPFPVDGLVQAKAIGATHAVVEQVPLTVHAASAAPVGVPEPATSLVDAIVDGTLTFGFHVTDDGGTLTPSWWLDGVHQADGPTFAFAATSSSVGLHVLDVVATDSHGQNASHRWALAVHAPDGDGDLWPASVDCNDADATIYPGAVDALNGIDDDCDASTPDGGEIPVVQLERVRSLEGSGCQLDSACEFPPKEGVRLTLHNASITSSETMRGLIDWGDGAIHTWESGSMTVRNEHVYVQDGQYLVRLCATTFSGGHACAETFATILNVAPGIQIDTPRTANASHLFESMPVPNGDFEAFDGWSWGNLGCSSPGPHTTGGNPGGWFRIEECGSCDTDPYVEREVRGFTPGANYLLYGDYRGVNEAGLHFNPEALWLSLDGTFVGSAPRLWGWVTRDWHQFTIAFTATNESHMFRLTAERGCEDSAFDIDNLVLGRDMLVEGAPIRFRAQPSDLGGADVLTVELRDVDGSLLRHASLYPNTRKFDADHTYLDDFNASLAMCVKDGANETCAPVGARVRNLPPVASLGAAVVQDLTASFASMSFHDRGVLDTHAATLDWGDGARDAWTPTTSNGTGLLPLAAHTYATPGSYVVTLCVLDDDGGEGCESATVEVAPPAPPEVQALGDLTGLGRDSTVAFAFTDPGSGPAHTVTIDWGDGTSSSGTPANDAGPVGTGDAQRVYPHVGNYTALVTVCDAGGLCGSATAVLSVVNFAPVVTATASPANEGSATLLSFAFTDELGSGGHTARVEWSDGASDVVELSQESLVNGTGNASHAFADDGEHAARVVVCDHAGACGETTIPIAVLNVPPVANDDALTVREGNNVTSDPAANDLDVAADLPLAVVGVTQGQHGVVTLERGLVTYAPGPERYSGADWFTYTVADGDGGFTTGIVRVTVLADLPPVIRDENVTVSRYGVVSGDALANDEDPEDTLRFAGLVQPPRSGEAVFDADGGFRYTPDPSRFADDDRFTYRVCDALDQCDFATVFVREDRCADGLQALDATLAGTLVSGLLHQEVEPRIATHDRALAQQFHDANCAYVGGGEDAVDAALVGVLP